MKIGKIEASICFCLVLSFFLSFFKNCFKSCIDNEQSESTESDHNSMQQRKVLRTLLKHIVPRDDVSSKSFIFSSLDITFFTFSLERIAQEGQHYSFVMFASIQMTQAVPFIGIYLQLIRFPGTN